MAIKKLNDALKTVSMTTLLVIKLFFIVTVILAVVTVLVLLGADNGFFVNNYSISVGGALVIIYSSCIVMAVSIAVSIRFAFLEPTSVMIQAMNQVAEGDFSMRLHPKTSGYEVGKIREFKTAFNKAAEQLESTELLRKDFINNFSHEFKTPIVSINGFAELLLEEDVPEEDRREYLTVIRDESKRLAQLASNILVLNRIENQTILTDREIFRVDEQLRQSVLVTQQKWHEKNLDFQVELLEAEYNGSETLLKEVWLNLLDNAAKFSNDGGAVSVELKKEKSTVTIAITDHGAGMTDSVKAHIFEQFYQGDTSHTTQGNGLGLTMVKKVLELHDAQIKVETKLGCGSSFIVCLPLK